MSGRSIPADRAVPGLICYPESTIAARAALVSFMLESRAIIMTTYCSVPLRLVLIVL